jgi:transcriptional regulator with XRE-family HTH domain
LIELDCEASHVSPAVFARLLNTSVSTVQKWEIGQKKPTGTSLKLLHLVQERGLEVVASARARAVPVIDFYLYLDKLLHLRYLEIK